ncbi:MAG: 30S ribosomal protein S7 [Bernardetiaceae bacterium]|nr:30S ribosomal protein S7 [Bernardetiaceae bacterium]
MRKRKPKKRVLQPDPRYNDTNVTQFVNHLMLAGKKSLAFRIFYDAMDLIEAKLAKSAEGGEVSGLEVFRKGLANVTPSVEVKSRRVGGATFQVPTEVRAGRKNALGMKWLISFARKRNERTMAERLCNELLAASRGEGAAVKKKDDTHRMADANKAFSHFRF